MQYNYRTITGTVVEYCSFNQFTTVTIEPLTGLFINDGSVAAQPESPQISNLKGHFWICHFALKPNNKSNLIKDNVMTTMNWPRVHIPESCKGVDIVIGVDEAGRGPVLGPLVYAAAFWPVSEDAEIQKMGFNDSKQLKESDRDGFFSSIRNHPSIGWVIEEITAADISRVR